MSFDKMNGALLQNDSDNVKHNNDNENEDCRIKIWNWSPDFLQHLNTINWFLFTLALASITQGIVINGLSVVFVSTIEKEFGISSKSAGVILSGNDASALLLVGIVSFFGCKAHKPKWIGIGVLLTGLGGFLFALPKLMIEPYRPVGEAQRIADMCIYNKTSPIIHCETNGSLLHVVIMFLAQFIMGAGITPLYTLGPAFLDENVNPKTSPIYLGVWFVSSMLGPGFGFIFGGQFLKIFTNIEQPKGLSLKPNDPRWIGAWWLGFVSISTLFFVSGFLLTMFPKHLPNSKEKREKAVQEGAIPKSDPTIEYTMKGFFKALVKICLNKIYVLAVIGLTIRLLFVIGLVSFLVKILEVKFGVAPSKASTLLGVVIIPSITCGILVGAFVMKKIKVQIAANNAAKICFVISMLTIPASLIYIIPACQNTQIAGLQTPYGNYSSANGLYVRCNAKCNCKETVFAPVCGSDGITYKSACFAGCNVMTRGSENKQLFGNCTCIPDQTISNSIMNTSESKASFFNYATPGACGRDCKNLAIFTAVVMISTTISFIAGTPHKILVLRSVPDNQRSFALGVQFFILRSLGFLPAPIVMGAVVDSQCTSWRYDSCGSKKNCGDYNIDNLSTNIATFGVAVACTASFIYAIVLVLFRKSKTSATTLVTDNDDENDAL